MAEKGSSRAFARKKRVSRDLLAGRVNLGPRAGVGKKPARLEEASLKNYLSPRLHHLLGANFRGKIFQKEKGFKAQRGLTPTGEGFEATMWHDEKGSSLFIQSLAPDGAINPQYRITSEDVLELAINTNDGLVEDAPDPLPQTIILATGNTPEATIAAREMLKDILRESGFDKTTYVLKETEPVGLNPLPGGFSRIGLTFKVIRRTVPDPIMDSQTFEVRMGGKPKDDVKFKLGGLIDLTVRKKSELYKEIRSNLGKFRDKLAENDQKTQEIEKSFLLDEYGFQIPAPDESVRRNQEIFTAADELIASLEKYIAESNTIPLVKSRKEKKDDKKGEVETLKKQVEDAKNDRFRRELDDLRRARWQVLNPLSEEQVIPGTRQVIGHGAQGEVVAATLRLNGGQEFRAALKPNQIGVNQEALNAGIPEDNPQQSARAVAVYNINRRVGLDVIPHTEFMVLVDGEEGRPKLGQALEFVRGSVGQRRAPERAHITDPGQIATLQVTRTIANAGTAGGYPADRVANAQRDMDQNYYFDIHTGNFHTKRNLPVDINYNDGVVQKGLSDLQLFDAIIGHADRHAENFIYVKNDAGQIIGVRGIDNDDSLGGRWRRKVPGDNTTSKTPGVPPIVDFSTALKILRADPESIRADMQQLSSDEQDAAVDRFRQVQGEVSERVRANAIASNDDEHDFDELVELSNLAKMPADTIPVIKNWGADLAADHTENNSYLGNILTMKAAYGTAPDLP